MIVPNDNIDNIVTVSINFVHRIGMKHFFPDVFRGSVFRVHHPELRFDE